jgi:hypothetical protein
MLNSFGITMMVNQWKRNCKKVIFLKKQKFRYISWLKGMARPGEPFIILFEYEPKMG